MIRKGNAKSVRYNKSNSIFVGFDMYGYTLFGQFDSFANFP
jgi:hypothetical protein